jgi:FkbM family methyltransferase
MRIQNVYSKTVRQIVSVFPHRILKALVDFLPAAFSVKLTKPMKWEKAYDLKLFEFEFILNSGPQDDHFLDIEKSGLKKWETLELQLWIDCLKSSDYAVDVGAYLGVYSILAAQSKAKMVLSIEPNKETFLLLKKNVSQNNLTDRVELHNLAVGDLFKSVQLAWRKGRPLSSGAYIADVSSQKSDTWAIQNQIEQVTLDWILRDVVGEVSVIKIDVEGYEFNVLKGAVNTLRASKPSLIIEILTKDRRNEIDEFLEQFGYHHSQPIGEGKKATNYFYQGT